MCSNDAGEGDGDAIRPVKGVGPRLAAPRVNDVPGRLAVGLGLHAPGRGRSRGGFRVGRVDGQAIGEQANGLR